MSQEESTSQFRKNVFYNLLTFLTTVLLGLWLPPLLINELSVEAYSLIPISMAIAAYMLVFTVVINGTLAKFLSIELHDDQGQGSKTYTTTIVALSCVLIVLLPFLIFAVIYIDQLISIPEGLLEEARLMFALIFGAFIFNTYAIIF